MGGLAGTLIGSVVGSAGLGAVLGVGSGLALAHRASPPDPAVSGFESWGELMAGPGAMTPERMFLAMNTRPDAYGWAAVPTTQSALGPALAHSTVHGPAYLMLPHDATMAQPPSYAMQQDVSPRAAEAARAFSGFLTRSGIEVVQAVRAWPGLPRAYGTTYRPKVGQNVLARRLAVRVARTTNLHAVLFAGSEPETFTVHFTDNAHMLMAAARRRGTTANQVAGLGSTDQEAHAPHTSARLVAGTAVGASTGALIADSIGVSRVSAVVGGALAGGVIAILSDHGPLPHATTEEGDVAREALHLAESDQIGRVFNIAVWGPTAYYAATKVKNPLVAGALGLGGTMLILGSVKGLITTSALRKRLKAAAARKPATVLTTELTP